MYNHVRTLLLNRKGAAIPPPYLAEEAVPPTFAPVRLSTALETCRRVLFGTDPDRYMMN